MKKTISILIIGLSINVHAAPPPNLNQEPSCPRNALRDILMVSVGLGGGILLNSIKNDKDEDSKKPPKKKTKKPISTDEDKKQRRKTLRKSLYPSEGSKIIQTVLSIFENGSQDVEKSIEVLSNLAKEKSDKDLENIIAEIKELEETKLEAEAQIFMKILAHVKSKYAKGDIDRVKGSNEVKKRLSQCFL